MKRSWQALATVLAALIAFHPVIGGAQQAVVQPDYPNPSAYPLTIDRGAAGLWQSLQRLRSRASLMMVTAHPDDEDGGMLAYESRGMGADTTLLTLNRGEGGQNVMTGDFWNELGLLRTQELLAAGDYYGVHQRFTRVADFGFSKSLEESLKTWGRDRVLYDVVRQVRISRPLVITSVFTGNVSDGHGHHQTAGVMAQEAFKLAGDPTVFPDQIAQGLEPWSPLKVYARVPFARVSSKGIFDYATGRYAPARYRNYVTGEWIEGVPTATVEIPEGTYNPLFGRSYLALGREGLSQQKSQNDGVGVPPAGRFTTPYHLYASRVQSPLPAQETSLFDGIDTTLRGIGDYAPAPARGALQRGLGEIEASVEEATKSYDATDPARCAPALARGLARTRALIAEVEAGSLPAAAKFNIRHELGIKAGQFETALAQSLGISLVATVDPPGEYQAATGGQQVAVDLHFANQGSQPIRLEAATLVPERGDWKVRAETSAGQIAANDAVDVHATATVPPDADPTRPYFTRPSLEQSYYDLLDPLYLGLPTALYPLGARATYLYGGVESEVGAVVQTVHRVNGIGPTLDPLLIAPPVSVSISPERGVIPLGEDHVKVDVVVRSSVQGPAEGTVKLNLPEGWTAAPASQPFTLGHDGDEVELGFSLKPAGLSEREYSVTAVATYGGKEYREGFTTIGYPGLRPYPQFHPSRYSATGVDVKVAPGLKVGYIAGTGDDVPVALGQIGVHPVPITPEELAGGDLSSFNAILVGVRAYANRPDLRTHNRRLLDYVRNGGVVVLEYQTAEFDHNLGPFPISVPQNAEKVVEEDSKVQITPNDPLLSWPNRITTADFDHWVEERGHGFAMSWAPQFVAPTEMHDVDQEPQRGGLLYARYGSGYYIYLAFAFFRQMPEGVPGSFRIMANLISAGKNPLH